RARCAAARSWRNTCSSPHRPPRSTPPARRSCARLFPFWKGEEANSQDGATSWSRRCAARDCRSRRSRTARSTCTPIAAATPGASASSCCRRKPSPPRPASISARTARRASCASPIRAAWATSKRPPCASHALFLRLLPEPLEARALGEHLRRVLRRRLVVGAGVHLQRRLGVAEAAQVLAQDPSADHAVDLGLGRRGPGREEP